MQNALLALVLGLVGGALGALAISGLKTPGPAGGPALAREDPGLAERVARLEARLDASPSLAGRPASVPVARSEGDEEGLAAPLTPDAEAALVERLAPDIEEVVAAKMEEIRAREAAEKEAQALRNQKKTMSLAEAAAEVGLSASEEDELRRLYGDMEDRILKILAGENGDLEEVRRDMESAKNDEAARPRLMAKYIPRVMPKLGELITMEAEKQARTVEIVGPERAERLDDIDIQESHPFGLGGTMTFQASSRR